MNHVFYLRFSILASIAGTFFALFAALSGQALAREQVTLTIAADVWCPINCDAAGPELGIGIDTAKRIFEPLGYKINYIIMPWARALEDARSGKVDAVVGANSSDDPTLLFPKTPIHLIIDGFYAQSGNKLEFRSIESLHDKRLGIVKNYGYSAPVQAFIKRQKASPGMIQEVGGENALEQNIKKLLAGRIDVVIESDAVMQHALKNLALSDRVEHIGAIVQGNVYLAFSPAKPESGKRLKQYDEGMAALRKSGELKALYARYGLSVP